LRAEKELLPDLQLLSIIAFLAIQLIQFFREFFGLYGALAMTATTLLSLIPARRFLRWLEAEIKSKGGLSVKHVVLWPAGVAAFVLLYFNGMLFVLEILIGMNREQAASVAGIIPSILLMILNIKIISRKTPEFDY
jgi:hypothetical protein